MSPQIHVPKGVSAMPTGLRLRQTSYRPTCAQEFVVGFGDVVSPHGNVIFRRPEKKGCQHRRDVDIIDLIFAHAKAGFVYFFLESRI